MAGAGQKIKSHFDISSEEMAKKFAPLFVAPPFGKTQAVLQNDFLAAKLGQNSCFGAKKHWQSRPEADAGEGHFLLSNRARQFRERRESYGQMGFLQD